MVPFFYIRYEVFTSGKNTCSALSTSNTFTRICDTGLPNVVLCFRVTSHSFVFAVM